MKTLIKINLSNYKNKDNKRNKTFHASIHQIVSQELINFNHIKSFVENYIFQLNSVPHVRVEIVIVAVHRFASIVDLPPVTFFLSLLQNKQF